MTIIINTKFKKRKYYINIKIINNININNISINNINIDNIININNININNTPQRTINMYSGPLSAYQLG